MPYTLDELEEALAARIEAIDPTPYQHAIGDAFNETRLPLTTVQSDSALQADLAFSVSVESAPVVDDGQASEGQLSVLATVAVVFLYRLRSDDQRRDTRTAIHAARAVTAAVMQPAVEWGSAHPINVYEPQAMQGEFLPVRLTFHCLIDLAI